MPSTSKVWAYFEKLTDGKMKCKILSCEATFKNQHAGTAGNHLYNKHRETYNQIEQEKIADGSSRKRRNFGNSEDTKAGQDSRAAALMARPTFTIRTFYSDEFQDYVWNFKREYGVCFNNHFMIFLFLDTSMPR